jgi:dipeptidyl aminopeptidase/acylaminoacyl peptidase
MNGSLRHWQTVTVVAAAAATLGAPAAAGTTAATRSDGVRVVAIQYRSHAGHLRDAVVLVPRAYDRRRHPALPLVISPHGRGGTGRGNALLWGNLPGRGQFVVVNPDGDGNHLRRFSWGARGQIDDLARMPEIVEHALPWLRIDRTRIYAFGGSMGGQETLLLVERHPRLLAGAAAFDSVVDFAAQYDRFPQIACDATCRVGWQGDEGAVLQRLARHELGGDPESAPAAYAERSPLSHVGALARAGVPLQIWWTPSDEVVRDPRTQSGRLLAELQRLEPAAPVSGIEGDWAHTHEFRSTALLPDALARFGLMPPQRTPSVPGLRIVRERSL